jgi:hypothetical protein
MNKLIVLKHKTLFAILFSILVLIIAVTAWCYLKPVKVTYRETIEMGIGDSRINIFTINKTGTLFSFGSIGLVFEPSADSINTTIISTDSTSSFLNSVDYYYVKVNCLSGINSGEHTLKAKLKIGFLELAQIPLTIIVQESADDIIDTAEGPQYRVNVINNPNFKPIRESMEPLDNGNYKVTYRSDISTRSGDISNIIFDISATNNNDWDNSSVNYTLGLLNNGKLEPLPDSINFKIINNIPLSAYSLKTIAVLSISPNNRGFESYGLGVLVQSGANDSMDIFPIKLTIDESSDDLFPVPSGALVYRSNIHLINSENGIENGVFAAIKETTISIP